MFPPFLYTPDFNFPSSSVTHIPFRDSKLTRILQTALSGNARIAVICTINPTLASKDESLNTLRFAQRAKLVKTAAKMTSVGLYIFLYLYIIGLYYYYYYYYVDHGQVRT